MPAPPTLLDYDRRIARAIAWLAANPGQSPSLEVLAAAAAFSPCHFHRIYRAMTGETPAATLARQRLQRAAGELLGTARPMARVARRAGFGSVAAFTRAFRAAHGLPPAAYRRRGGIGRPLQECPMQESTMFDVTIEVMPPLRLAAIRHTGPYADIAPTFDRLASWARARGLLEGPRRVFGLYHDDPDSVPPARLRADACVTIGPDVVVEGEARLLELPAFEAATVVFQGPYAELGKVYDWLYGTWLPGSGREPADQPPMDEALNNPRQHPPSAWLTRVIIPLRPA
ncbi:AraC family transcriptional regulator [Roseomonas aerophila]|uniref:AraC family transcriptional regulator n=1 Tax=Teichococcus aerophilus TaxID=1224513 RepID=A0ABR7RK06_9PROT|nr:AraC family transcriptional regulator [Pseudoroseomonas aerophila]MBC9206914.1 AraC family transcriptional regulator [Pseudoroseomonas aerophila]